MRKLSAALLICALLASSVCAAPASAQTALHHAVGRVNVAGYNARGHCTGALVAPDKVLTAAHCLTGRNGRPAPLGDIHFLPGADRGGYLAHGRARCVSFLEGGEGLARDAAIIHLREPMTIAPLPVRPGAAPEKGETVSLAGYPRRRAHALSIDEDCAITGRHGGVLYSDCFAEPGLSGGPVLSRNNDGELEIAAIAVAATKQGRAVALPAAHWRRLLERSCNSP